MPPYFMKDNGLEEINCPHFPWQKSNPFVHLKKQLKGTTRHWWHDFRHFVKRSLNIPNKPHVDTK